MFLLLSQSNPYFEERNNNQNNQMAHKDLEGIEIDLKDRFKEQDKIIKFHHFDDMSLETKEELISSAEEDESGDDSSQNNSSSLISLNSENKIIQPTFNPFSLLFFDILFKNNFLKTKEDILKYILEIMKKEDIMDLNEKYICSIYLNMNKNLLTKEIIEEILSQEFHLTLMICIISWQDLKIYTNTVDCFMGLIKHLLIG